MLRRRTWPTSSRVSRCTLNIPLSIYIGRIQLSSAPAQLAVQAVWVVILALLTRLLWRRAAARVVSQGG
jgi:ABC-2 type transport system permease protein